MNNHSIVNSSTFTNAAQPQQAMQAEQHNDPLIHIVLTEAGRAINFITGMVGSFFNPPQGSVNLSAAEPITDQPLNAQIEEDDNDSDHCPQTPNPQMYPSRSERTQISYPQTPNPERFPSNANNR